MPKGDNRVRGFQEEVNEPSYRMDETVICRERQSSQGTSRCAARRSRRAWKRVSLSLVGPAELHSPEGRKSLHTPKDLGKEICSGKPRQLLSNYAELSP